MLKLDDQIIELLGPIDDMYMKDLEIFEHILSMRLLGLEMKMGEFFFLRKKIYERMAEIDRERALLNFQDTVADLMTESYRRSIAAKQ